ncbi:MAG: glutamate racemase [Pseudomonadota bacterium]
MSPSSAESRDASNSVADLPIGVFDSGVGGLTVLKAMRDALPQEHFLYLGDTARLPYGTKSPASIARYASQATAVLSARGIKLLVVACNTASAVALDALQQQLKPVPVIGVIEPGAAAAVAAGRNHLVLATEATVRLGAYRDAIQRRDDSASVRELACEMLVALAEEGWDDDEITRQCIHRYLEPVRSAGYVADTVILGCTHFPLLRPAVVDVVEPGVAVVDSASTTAGVVAEHLASSGLARSVSNRGSLRLLATDGATRFARVGGHFLGETLATTDIEIVDL